jgi:putative transposase
MTFIKCYRFRLMPTAEQEQKLRRFAGCRRFVWNWALGRKRSHYKESGTGIGYHALAAELVRLKKEPAYAFLQECPAQALQQSLLDLEAAFRHFFRHRANFPRLKTKKRTPHAFRLPQGVVVLDGKVTIPKVGLVSVVVHREMEGRLKSATIKQEPSGPWFITFVSHVERPNIGVSPCERPVGIDVGLQSFVTLDSGEKIAPPKFHRSSERRLKRLQRRLSRRRKTSRRRAKAKRHFAKVSCQIKNRRSDWLHQLSHRLVSTYDTLCIEDLNIAGLVKTKLAKSFSDAAISTFLRMLEYKAEWCGHQVVKVGRFFPSSRTCHQCGHRQSLHLADRTWTCEECASEHDRDQNAAINIRIEGLRILAVGTTERLNDSGENVRLSTGSSSQ